MVRSAIALSTLAVTVLCLPLAAGADEDHGRDRRPSSIQLGPRPYYPVDKLADGPLNPSCAKCERSPSLRKC